MFLQRALISTLIQKGCKPNQYNYDFQEEANRDRIRDSIAEGFKCIRNVYLKQSVGRKYGKLLRFEKSGQ